MRGSWSAGPAYRHRVFGGSRSDVFLARPGAPDPGCRPHAAVTAARCFCPPHAGLRGSMSGSGKEDPAIHRLRQHMRSLRTDPPMPIKDLQAKLERTLGKIPMFPNQFIYVMNYATHEVLFAQGFEHVLGYPDDKVGIDFIWSLWHPDDAPILAKFTEMVTRMVFNIRPALQPF